MKHLSRTTSPTEVDKMSSDHIKKNMDHGSRASRRNVLAFLGLAGAGAPILQTEAMALDQNGGDSRHKGEKDLDIQFGHLISVSATAHALRQLADGLESGRVVPEGIDLKSSLGQHNDGWLQQEFRFQFFVTAEGNESKCNQQDGFVWLPDKEAAEVLGPCVQRHAFPDPGRYNFSGMIQDLERAGFALVKLT